MKHSYIIIDDDPNSVLKTKAIADGFRELQYLGAAGDYDTAVDLILELNPAIVFLEINPVDPSTNLSLQLINELHRYLKTVPKIIITANDTELALEAIKYEVFDYFIKPINVSGFRKALRKFEKSTIFSIDPVKSKSFVISQEHPVALPKIESSEESQIAVAQEVSSQEITEVLHPQADMQEIVKDTAGAPAKEVYVEETKVKEEKPLIICVKSYGDYRFIEAKDICYLQADNNSTDIHLYNGEMITAFKTLKHFEGVLTSPFVRIHNSYIVNIDYVSRIHTGNAVCYIKNTTIKLPFSKSYKENVDSIINSITTGNYLEI